jgi:probable rRNA maturation factor
VLDRTAHEPLSQRGQVAELTIVLADDNEVQRLNREYRGVNKATNVLSFGDAGDRRQQATGEPVILGDVILARETVAAEAAAQGKSIADHSLHLVVHGILHLLGHDHESVREADAMEALETDLLARLGIANPYAVRAGRRARRQV